MEDSYLVKLQEDVAELARDGVTHFGILGTDIRGLTMLNWFSNLLPGCAVTWYGESPLIQASGQRLSPLFKLLDDQPAVVVVVEDATKERVVREALPYLTYNPKLLVSGYKHYDFRDELFEKITADLLVPSIANGYANTLVHLYQCMVNAARLGISGSVVEFGVFKGGTTMLLAKLVEELNVSWPIIGFDTFGGFPPRRSALDMYDHPGAEFRDYDAVSAYLNPVGVTLVRGDIVETAQQLADQPIVIGFIDTDNYSSAKSAIAAIQNNVGAIIFDHLTGENRFRYT